MNKSHNHTSRIIEVPPSVAARVGSLRVRAALMGEASKILVMSPMQVRKLREHALAMIAEAVEIAAELEATEAYALEGLE